MRIHLCPPQLVMEDLPLSEWEASHVTGSLAVAVPFDSRPRESFSYLVEIGFSVTWSSGFKNRSPEVMGEILSLRVECLTLGLVWARG